MRKNKIKNKKQNNISMDNNPTIIQQNHLIREEYEGLIPHPNIIDGYEKNCPGATDRILTMTENQLKTSQEIAKAEQQNIAECRKETLNIEGDMAKRGQIFGFISIVIMLVGGFMLIMTGKDTQGFASIVASIMLGLGSVLWKNRIDEKNKNKTKENE